MLKQISVRSVGLALIASAVPAAPALAELTIDLRVAGGAKSAIVQQVGDVVPLELYARVTGSNAFTSDDQVWSLFGSVLSLNVDGGVVRGDLTAAVTHPFQSTALIGGKTTLLYSDGSRTDLDADGDLDVGSNADASSDGFLFARGETNGPPGPFTPPFPGTPTPGGGVEWKIADLSFQITSILPDPLPAAQTSVNFRWRNPTSPLSIIAIWEEDGVWYSRDQQTRLYSTGDLAPGVDITTGTPLLLTFAAPEPAALSTLAFLLPLLSRRRRHLA